MILKFVSMFYKIGRKNYVKFDDSMIWSTLLHNFDEFSDDLPEHFNTLEPVHCI